MNDQDGSDAMAHPIRHITAESFAKYGHVIEHDGRPGEGFQVVLSEWEGVGWRIAVNRITDTAAAKLARHPNSMESFEPVEGVTLLIVAATDAPQDIEVFLLDRPVCLFKDIWHATICLSEHSVVKITENLEVDSVERRLDRPIEVTAG
jgi:ureidoglycolate hydrolase